MLEKLRVIFTIPELRKKIFLTLALLAVYRVGWQITLPVIDQAAAHQASQEGGGFNDFLRQVSVFSASQLTQMTIFGLGIMPYISASIILQLLGTVWKPLEDLRKEGEAGRKKINEYTRYLTVLFCVFQSWFFVRMSTASGGGPSILLPQFTSDGELTLFWTITCVLVMTAGTIFLMWLGEQIDEYGIGNGISLLIMAGILAQMPAALFSMADNFDFRLGGLGDGQTSVEEIVVLGFLFVAVIAGVVFITLGKRQIPIHAAKHVRGNRVYGGTKSSLPLRLNMSGVMPIIFASSLLMLPAIVFNLMQSWLPAYAPTFASLSEMFSSGTSFLYNLLYVVLIYVFSYFWTAVIFNPKEMAENLRESGTFIQGYRPGKSTEKYLERVFERLTFVGAGFLAVVAIVPTILNSLMKVDFMIASFYGGTSLLIAVSVAFDLVQKIDSHLVMRNYRGLLGD
jgi:preprotein translocase subunit SecY